MRPVIGRTLIGSEDIEFFRWEFSIDSWEYIVERKSVCRKVDPSGVGCEVSPGPTRPESEPLTPNSNVLHIFAHVCGKGFDVELPRKVSLSSNILLEDFVPVWV